MRINKMTHGMTQFENKLIETPSSKLWRKVFLMRYKHTGRIESSKIEADKAVQEFQQSMDNFKDNV